MSQPQPGADRPADGGTPATGRNGDPVVAGPPADGPSQADAALPSTTEAASAPESAPLESATPDAEAGSAAPDPQPAPRTEAAREGEPTPQIEAAQAEATPQGEPTPQAAEAGQPEPAVQADPDGQADEAAPTTGAEPAPEAQPDAQAAPGADADTAEQARPADPDPTPISPAPARGSAAVPGPARAAGSARVTPRPDATRVERHPDPTKVEDAGSRTRVETPPAPRWSGSAAVPPPPPRKRAWGESAEPTPVPPVDSPEHQVPVDPWAGVDTTGWDLHSADFPALPPTLPYTSPYPVPQPPPAHVPHHPAPPVAAAPPVNPPPVSPNPARPVSPPAPPKQRRGKKNPPPVTAPPGWGPPKGYVAVPVRRRRRWPWVLLLSVACCCGVPLWWAQPLSAQYPATASMPDQLGSLRLRQDEGSQAAAAELKQQVRQAHLLAEDTFAGIYTTGDGKRVTLFGGTGFRLSPESDAQAELDRLTDRYALKPSVPVETGVRGRYERCAVGRSDGDTVVVCTSVDHGSLATGVFTRLSVEDSGRLLDDLRRQVVTPQQS
ncbi:hypothetical protein ACFFMM_31125 [Micromonospora chaiyaphumensis]|uniref:Uncharacterized protein n=1 Tax=Micromonospora chaiyaphumensis TaxID=307119 RepID=A0A1C4ZKE9_9ACTN|nr:hypothetical protein [Micromonospora chaiyaphumensis]SCF33369.1 hypothetical protein GA0070214_11615 [Micromonospora chaiyaphumensis]